MSGKLDPNDLAGCKKTLNTVLADKSLLDDPSLRFLRSFLEEMGAKLPAMSTPNSPEPGAESAAAVDHEDDEDEEEQDDKRMKPEDIPPPPLGPEYEPETSEAEIEAAIEAKGKAAEALEAEKYSEAVEHLTTALSVMPSALMYARRAEALLKDHRPIAAVHDCDAALKLNPDSAKALKTRGAANRALGRWEAANSDLSQGLSIDFDEAAFQLQKEVLEHQKRKHDRMEAKKAAERAKREKEAKAAAAAKAEEEAHGSAGGDGMPGMGGMPGLGGMPPGMNPEVMSKLMSDPELMAAMQNPKVMQAMMQMQSNPAAAMQYMSDPEVGPILMKIASTFGGSMGGTSAAPSSTAPPSSTVDIDEVD